MQKNNIKASILIWATFLSLIISVTFISISTKINKNIKNNKSYTRQLEINNEIKNLLNSGSLNGNYTDTILSNGDEIKFSNHSIFSGSINKGETHISKINTVSLINLNILSGGPLKYKIKTNSGLVFTSSGFTPTNTGILEILNLGGYTTFEIKTNNTDNFASKYKTYEISKQIGNKIIIKSKGTIKNF